MENFNDLLNEINGKTFTKITDLEVNKNYNVNNLEKSHLMYGIRVQVYCDDNIKFTLPESWNDRLTPDKIDQLLKCGKQIYIIYKGTIDLPNNRSKHNLTFTLE